jgi:DNA-binding winged helix-turn-helix (wHTH) protein
MRVAFGDFVLDDGTRQLLRKGEACHLGPKAFELLDLLLRQRPNVVTREAIRNRLWPGTFVSESTLATVVTEVRAALAEDPKAPRFVRTAHRVGYAFCGQVDGAAPHPQPTPRSMTYRLVLPDREVALHPGENVIGRVEDGVAWLASPTVSRRHARIVVEAGRAILEDLGSKNGTFVHDKRISAPTPLAHGDVIRLGRVSMTLLALRADETTRSTVE